MTSQKLHNMILELQSLKWKLWVRENKKISEKKWKISSILLAILQEKKYLNNVCNNHQYPTLMDITIHQIQCLPVPLSPPTQTLYLSIYIMILYNSFNFVEPEPLAQNA